MHITWHGNYTIKLQSGETTLVIDPHGSFRGKADIVALSHPSDPALSHLRGIQGEPLVLEAPGEYSVAGFTLHGIGWFDDQERQHSLQRWDIEKMVLLHLGALDRPLADTELQELERTGVDILFLPVDDKTLKLKFALEILTTIEPRVVIPINYTDIKPFAKELGIDPKESHNKFIAKANKLPAEELETVILKP